MKRMRTRRTSQAGTTNNSMQRTALRAAADAERLAGLVIAGPAMRNNDVTSTVRTAMERDLPVTFRYRRPDGKVTTHNAVYPRRLDLEGDHDLLHAYCHFTRDNRTFRLDRIESIRLGLARRAGVPEAIFAAFVVALLLFFIFLFLLFFSPKYRWRNLRHELLGLHHGAAEQSWRAGALTGRPSTRLNPTLKILGRIEGGFGGVSVVNSASWLGRLG